MALYDTASCAKKIDEEMATVLDAETTPVGNIFGQVSYGFICLRGRLFRCTAKWGILGV
jgi:hypothetical protein